MGLRHAPLEEIDFEQRDNLYIAVSYESMDLSHAESRSVRV